jgi:glutamyl-tRNA reductase
VLVVGAGSMSALAATTLADVGADVVIVNRTLEHAQRLASSTGGTAAPMDAIPGLLADVDLLVSCTGAAGIVVAHDMVEAVVRERAGRPLGILDLAMPHDVDTTVAELPGVVLADLATLAESNDADGGAITVDVDAVRSIVVDEVSAYSAARRVDRVAPTVVALRAMAADVVEAELGRMEGRLPGLDERTRAEVSATVRRVVDKLLHSPTVRVKELASQPDGASYEDALRELFSLDHRAIDAVAKPDVPIDPERGERP